MSTPEIIEFSVSISDGTSKLVKIIPVSVIPYKPEFEQVTIIRTAADNYNQYNYPGNAIDDNISTRWSADGDGQWIWLQLAYPASINMVLELAFLPDQENANIYFNIYASLKTTQPLGAFRFWLMLLGVSLMVKCRYLISLQKNQQRNTPLFEAYWQW